MKLLKFIPNHPGYLVDHEGNIYSNKNKDGLLRKLKPHDDHRGYLIVNIKRKDGKPRAAKIHHLVLEAFVGPKPSETHLARHLNDDSFDNTIFNLKWGTNEENKKDKAKNLKNRYRAICDKRKTSEVKKEILMKIYISGICSVPELSLISGWREEIIKGVVES